MCINNSYTVLDLSLTSFISYELLCFSYIRHTPLSLTSDVIIHISHSCSTYIILYTVNAKIVSQFFKYIYFI